MVEIVVVDNYLNYSLNYSLYDAIEIEYFLDSNIHHYNHENNLHYHLFDDYHNSTNFDDDEKDNVVENDL